MPLQTLKFTSTRFRLSLKRLADRQAPLRRLSILRESLMAWIRSLGTVKVAGKCISAVESLNGVHSNIYKQLKLENS